MLVLVVFSSEGWYFAPRRERSDAIFKLYIFCEPPFIQSFPKIQVSHEIVSTVDIQKSKIGFRKSIQKPEKTQKCYVWNQSKQNCASSR